MRVLDKRKANEIRKTFGILKTPQSAKERAVYAEAKKLGVRIKRLPLSFHLTGAGVDLKVADLKHVKISDLKAAMGREHE